MQEFMTLKPAWLALHMVREDVEALLSSHASCADDLMLPLISARMMRTSKIQHHKSRSEHKDMANYFHKDFTDVFFDEAWPKHWWMNVTGWTRSVAGTYWKNLKAFTVNPLEENKSFRSSSLTEELQDQDGKKKLFIFNRTPRREWKNTKQVMDLTGCWRGAASPTEGRCCWSFWSRAFWSGGGRSLRSPESAPVLLAPPLRGAAAPPGVWTASPGSRYRGDAGRSGDSLLKEEGGGERCLRKFPWMFSKKKNFFFAEGHLWWPWELQIQKKHNVFTACSCSYWSVVVIGTLRATVDITN